MDNAYQNFVVLLDAIWRQRWIALILAWVISVVGWLGVSQLPDKYQSEARIYVDTATLLAPLLKGIAIDSARASEIQVMQRTLLSRPNMAQVARATDLDLEATNSLEMQALLEDLAERTRIDGTGRNLFSVSHVNTDPVLAKAVVQSLLTIFVESNLGENRTDMEEAQTFIAKQIAQYEEQLKAAEQRLAEFKAQNSDVLGSMNFSSRLTAARDTLGSIQLDHEEAILRRDQLREQFESVPQFLEVGTNNPQVVINGARQTPLQARIGELELRLDALRLRFTENHPDVIATRDSLEVLRQQLEEGQAQVEAANGEDGEDGADGVTQSMKIPNTLYENIKLKLVDAESEVVGLNRRVSLAKVKVGELEEIAQIAPKVEAQLADLDRDYEIVKNQHAEFLQRRESARISQAAEETTNVVNFRVIEPPQVPALPSSPNRPMFMTLALFVGLGAGVGFTVALGQLDRSFRTPENLESAFGLPVLGSVSTIMTENENRRRAIGNIFFWTGVGVLLFVYAIVVVIAAKIGFVVDILEGTNLSSVPAFVPELLDKLGIMPFLERFLSYGG